MSARILPQTISVGDSVALEIFLPSPPGDETWARADLNMRRIRDTEVTILAESTTTLTADMAEIDIPAATTTTMADGAYRYRIWLTGSEGTARTIENGVVDVNDPLDPSRNYEERMVDICRNVLEMRMTGSGDVSSYSMGDHQINMMPIYALQSLIAEYEEKLQQKRGGRRCFLKRRIY